MKIYSFHWPNSDKELSKDPIKILRNHLSIDFQVPAYRVKLPILLFEQFLPLLHPLSFRCLQILYKVDDGDWKG